MPRADGLPSSPSSAAQRRQVARCSTGSSASAAAIVEDRARTTRDRLYGDAEWNGRRFVVVDTGGLEIVPGDPIEEQVQVQARLAISEADVIVFVVDAAVGPTPADQDAAELLRKTTKPVLVAANKADNQQRELNAAEFYAFGWEDTFAISASHGRGVADLLDAVVWAMPPETEAEIARKTREAEAEAFAKEMARARPRRSWWAGGDATMTTRRPTTTTRERGQRRGHRRPLGRGDGGRRRRAAGDRVRRPAERRQVSLLNALLGETRTIVSSTPGTTRDAIDTTIPWGRSRGRAHRHGGHPAARQGRERPGRGQVLDDARAQGDLACGRRGARAGRRRRPDRAGRPRRGLRDRGGPGPRHRGQQVGHRRGQDPQVVRRARRSSCGASSRSSTTRRSSRSARRPASACRRCWSWRSRSGASAAADRDRASSTGSSRAAIERTPPAVVHGKRPKIRYATQVGVAPPTFVFFTTDPASVHFSYRRYLENRLRDAYDFTGTPIRLVFREQVREKRPKGKSRKRG